MQLREYPLNKELLDVLERYARDNSLHTPSLIENLIEKFLYDVNYISVEYEDEVVLTPSEIYAERRNKFKKVSQKSNVRVYYEELDFSSFDPSEVEEIITKLSSFSDEELEVISKNNWKGSHAKYKKFLLEKLENPSLSKEEFLENEKWRWSERSSRNSTVVCIEFKGSQIVQFNTDKYDLENIEKTFNFLKSLSDDEVIDLHNKRKELKEVSAEFFLKQMESNKEENSKFVKKKHMHIQQNGNISLYKQGHSFGTHSVEKVMDVWNWLNDREWDFSYSTNETKLTRKRYTDWLYAEMKKENFKMRDE